MERLENLSTHDLRDGDIVLAYGMRIKLNGEGTVSKSHPINDASPTLWWAGEILNRTEVLEDGFVPRSWISEGLWTVQGNGLARWTVERP